LRASLGDYDVEVVYVPEWKGVCHRCGLIIQTKIWGEVFETISGHVCDPTKKKL
jgi:hypothetical protein